MSGIYKIAITGTKGKTTIVRLLDHIFLKLNNKTLRVDNDGWYINNKRRGTTDDSKKIFGLIPSVCPGKFLLEAKNTPIKIAIMEAAIGSSAPPGLGYRNHDIGIWTNVYEEHITGKRIKSTSDIIKAKKFIFRRISENGIAIANADDKRVMKATTSIPQNKNISILPYGIKYSYFDLKKHFKNGGSAITIQDSIIFFNKGKRKTQILDAKKIPFTFNADFTPSLNNIMASLAATIAYNNFKIPKGIDKILSSYKMKEKGGRLVEKNIKGRRIIIDFAHEIQSLKQILKLGKKLGKKCLAVIRLAPDRKNSFIEKTGMTIANIADQYFVWDKIDGIRRKKFKSLYLNKTREVGEVSKLLTRAILEKKKNKKAYNLITEERAIKNASQNSKSGDCVIIISGNDHEYTLKMVKKYFSKL